MYTLLPEPIELCLIYEPKCNYYTCKCNAHIGSSSMGPCASYLLMQSNLIVTKYYRGSKLVRYSRYSL